MLDLSSIPLDQKRLSAEVVADQDVIRSLKSNGDIPSIVRPVDVRFVGALGALRRLEIDLKGAGWAAIQMIEMDDGEYALDVQHQQTTEPDALQALTETALKIETKYAVRYDGWGCVAQTGKTK